MKKEKGCITMAVSLPVEVYEKIERERAEMEQKTGITITRSAYVSKRLKEVVML
jgi:hypothetical protein